MRRGFAFFVGMTLGSLICEAAPALDAHDILDLSAGGFRPALIVRILREMGDSAVISDHGLRELESAGVDGQILAHLRSREGSLRAGATAAPRPVEGAPQLVAALPRFVPEEPEPAAAAAPSHSLDPNGLVRRLMELRRRESTPSIWPARGEVTSYYGYRSSPISGLREFHGGIDVAAAPDSDIVATAPGRVAHAGELGSLGQAVVIDHGFGVRTFLGHAGTLHVKTGQLVERGDRVASVGSSGRSTGPHVHYAVEVAGRPVDPLGYVRR